MNSTPPFVCAHSAASFERLSSHSCFWLIKSLNPEDPITTQWVAPPGDPISYVPNPIGLSPIIFDALLTNLSWAFLNASGFLSSRL